MTKDFAEYIRAKLKPELDTEYAGKECPVCDGSGKDSDDPRYDCGWCTDGRIPADRKDQ